MSKKGGYYCAYKHCRSLSRRDKRSFFRFPKDPIRSKQWVEACDRNDLSDKTPIELFNSYRVCAMHFTDAMFLNDLRNRLQPNSIPVQGGQTESHDDLEKIKRKHTKLAEIVKDNLQREKKQQREAALRAEMTELSQAVSVITNEEIYPSESVNISSSSLEEENELAQFTTNSFAIEINNEDSSNFAIEALNCLDIINSLPITLFPSPPADTDEMPSIVSPHDHQDGSSSHDYDGLPVTLLEDLPTVSSSITVPLTINLADTSTQTDTSYLEDRVYKLKLKRILHRKRNVIKNLKKKVHQNLYDMIDNITIDEYELLTDKFFPKETSDFIKLQAQLFKKNNKCKEYSPEFKKYCLSLFLAGPKLYKYFQKLFCLPGLREIQMVKDSVHI